MECIEGLRKPDRGTISVLGLDPHREVYRAMPGVDAVICNGKRITIRGSFELLRLNRSAMKTLGLYLDCQ